MMHSGDIELTQSGSSQSSSSSWLCCCGPVQNSSYQQNGDHASPNQLVTQVAQGQQNTDVKYMEPPVPRTQDADSLLPPVQERHANKKCLVLDLDETLVHSSFTPVPNADFVISLTLENAIHRVYVSKRPGVEDFLAFCGKHFEVVMFTASLSKYADPLLDRLDPARNVSYRLFREHCVYYQNSYVKDLSRLGRPLKDCIIVDNSPYSYMFQRDNSIPVISWYHDKADRQLFELVPFLEKLAVVDDVTTVLRKDRLNWASAPFDENV